MDFELILNLRIFHMYKAIPWDELYVSHASSVHGKVISCNGFSMSESWLQHEVSYVLTESALLFLAIQTPITQKLY